MNHNEKFNETVGILVRAYMKGTLKHGECHACAVGNIVDHYRPISNIEKRLMKNHEQGWNKVFCTLTDSFDLEKSQVIRFFNYKGLAKDQIEATGYSYLELARIEKAFEFVPESNDKDQRMFNGLMAVVDVLAEIHGIDLTEKESAKLLFVKA